MMKCDIKTEQATVNFSLDGGRVRGSNRNKSKMITELNQLSDSLLTIK